MARQASRMLGARTRRSDIVPLGPGFSQAVPAIVRIGDDTGSGRYFFNIAGQFSTTLYGVACGVGVGVCMANS